MKTMESITATIVTWCVLTTPAAPQDVLVPLDRDGRIDKIDPEMEIKLQLFPEVKDFKQVYLFQLADGSYMLEIWSESKGKMSRIRRSMSQTEVDSLRARVTSAIFLRAPMTGLNQEGRTKLIAGISSLGLGFYGWGIPYVLDIQEPTAMVGMYLLIGGGSIIFAYGMTEHLEVSEEAANLFSYGSVLGIAHGLFVHAILYGDEATPRGYVGTAMIGGLAESIVGFTAADRLKLTPGTVELIGTTSGFGILYGLGVSHVAELTGRRSFAAAMLAGSVAGTAVGATLSSLQDYTNGDVAVFRTAGVLGAYIPIAVLVAAERSDSKEYVTWAMLGGLVGGFAGHLLIVDKDFTTTEGTFVSLGTFGGGLLGWGVATLAKAEASITFPVAAATALAGYAAMYKTYAPSAKSRAVQTSWDFTIHPEGLLAMTRVGNHLQNQRAVLPIARLQYQF